MIGEILFSAACFVTGMLIPKILGLHKCKYEIIYHTTLDKVPFTVSYETTDRERYADFKLDAKAVHISCKECSVCKKQTVLIGNGTNRKFNFNQEFVLDALKIEMRKEKEKEEQEMLARMEERSKTPEQKIKEAELEILERNAVMEAEKVKAEAARVKELARIEEIKLKQAEVKKQQEEIELKRHEQREAKLLREMNKAQNDAMKAPGEGDIMYIAHKMNDSEDDNRKIKKKGRIRA